MKLYINQEPIDIQLENETVLGEVISDLDHKFKEYNNKIISIQANDEFIDLYNAEWERIPLIDIETLQIEVEENSIARIKILHTILEYLTILDTACREHTYIENFNLEDLKILLESIDTICCESESEHKSLQILLHYFCNSVQIFSGKKELEFQASSELVLLHLINIVKTYIYFALNTDNTLQEINAQIQNLIEQGYIKTSELFIKGEEEIAIHFIISTHDIFIKWLFYIQEEFHTSKSNPNTDKINPEQLNLSLKSFFEEQSEAMEANDWISVGDLIEYEICPLILDYIQNIDYDSLQK